MDDTWKSLDEDVIYGSRCTDVAESMARSWPLVAPLKALVAQLGASAGPLGPLVDQLEDAAKKAYLLGSSGARDVDEPLDLAHCFHATMPTLFHWRDEFWIWSESDGAFRVVPFETELKPALMRYVIACRGWTKADIAHDYSREESMAETIKGLKIALKYNYALPD